jgi:tight adherence protein B
VSPLLLGIAVFVGVAAIVGGAALFLQDKPASKIESRLDMLTGVSSSGVKEAAAKEATILAQPLDDRPGIVQSFLERFANIDLVFEQADTNLNVTKLIGISAILGVLGVAVGIILHIHMAIIPLMGVFMAMLPLIWILFRRGRRLKAFAAQLPDALEMLSRGLRSGQSMVFGFNMVANEMPSPISREFGRVFEEQNLGIPLEESLRAMANRIPNLDLKFFVTAVVLQRQTGGDLAEILDKIGSLIRDRFRIWGQVQALTGEGRLSGVVLLGLPFVLFLAVYQLNPDYLMTLFTDPIGKKMLGVAVVMQIAGALVIRKIVNIKV